MRVLFAGALAIVLVVAAYADPILRNIITKSKPWTRDLAEREPGKFHFAIVTDRTGDHRPGVFRSAIPRLNSMDPDFVMSVGDFIEGYTEDEAKLDRQWEEFCDAVDQLEMPFFFVPGNHDITGPVERKVWTRRFGPTYYAFTYEDVLFLCLDTIEGPSHKDFQKNEWPYYGVSDDQIAWVQKTIQDHSDVRWTFVFMHIPLWTTDEDPERNNRLGTGFEEVMEILKSRPHTVFAGHHHIYTRYVREGHEYYKLATTGGSSSLAGPAEGSFDHITWVTVSKGPPDIAQILLSGILPRDVYTETHVEFRRDIKVRTTRQPPPNDQQFTFRVSAKNIWAEELHYTIKWDTDKSPGWKVVPAVSEGTVAPNQETAIEFTAVRGKQRFPLPSVTCIFKAGQVTGEADVPIMDAYLEASR